MVTKWVRNYVLTSAIDFSFLKQLTASGWVTYNKSFQVIKKQSKFFDYLENYGVHSSRLSQQLRITVTLTDCSSIFKHMIVNYFKQYCSQIAPRSSAQYEPAKILHNFFRTDITSNDDVTSFELTVVIAKNGNEKKSDNDY